MPDFHRPFSGFSVDNTERVRSFYTEVLGLTVTEGNGILHIDLGDDHSVIVYPKGDAHVPATFTVLNLPTDDVSAAVRDLADRGVEFERYDGMPQDEEGVMKGHGPDIAWFKDPAGNVFSVIAS
ncbi:VOC family protein [Aeromicrobium panaciterrae]|uniref:VOC family protein n=1 Tax=Aeromicrobium panaciterrae TaxID=363861 RepID=UPI0031D10098